MARDTHSLRPRASAQAHRHRKGMLAVRAMAGETAWLDGRLRWHEGRVVWEDERGLMAPDPQDLSLAQRRLNQIGGYPRAAKRALGDVPAWLERRSARLELAKRFHTLYAPDLAALVQPVHTRQPQSQRRLVTLLPAEALCLGGLPASPAAALLACGEQAVAPLQTMLNEQHAPLAGRALAALLLGAIQGQPLDSQPADAPASGGWLRRANVWGVQAGLPPDPALIVALLEAADGQELARRCVQTLGSTSPFRLNPELLRELLAGGTAAATVVSLAEAAVAAEPLATRMLQRRGELPPEASRQRRALAERLLQQRQQAVAALAEVLLAYVQACGDPAVIKLIVSFSYGMLELGPLTPELADAISGALRGGLELKQELRQPYLELLVTQHSRLWDRASLKEKATPAELAIWIGQRRAGQLDPLLRLLVSCGDIVVAREALELGILRTMVRYTWRDPALCRWLLTLERSFNADRDDWITSRLCTTLSGFGSIGAARAVLQPLTDGLMAAPSELRGWLLLGLIEEIERTGLVLRETLPRLLRFLPQVIGFARRSTDTTLCWWLLLGLLALERNFPEQAPQWLEWLFGHLLNLQRQSENGLINNAGSLSVGTLLAATLCDGELTRFQGILRAAMQHHFEQDQSLLERSIPVLARYRGLRTPLVQLFPQQPQRCGGLIVRVGLLARLGPAALEALEALERQNGRTEEQGNSRTQEHRNTGTEEQRNSRTQEQQNTGTAEQGGTGEQQNRGTAEHRNSRTQEQEGGGVPLFSASFVPLFFSSVTPFDLSGWRELLERAPELELLAVSYLHAQQLRGQSLDLPPGVRRALDLPRKLGGELSYLQGVLAQQPDRQDLAARLGNLQERLGDQRRLDAVVRSSLAERLEQLTAEVQLAAAEQQVLACYQARLASLAGPLPDSLVFDDDLLNATLLLGDISQNRRLLRRLLRAHLAGEQQWREQHPANAVFLQGLAARGLSPELWLGAHPRRYRCEAVAGGRVRLHLEQNPVRILQMGNLFDTCLSFGGINSFSTVVNACELNKRVVYASDGKGRVVGRKLIAINSSGDLVGFHTYSALTAEADNHTLRAIFRRYLEDFASRCGLALSDQGDVPTLFAEAWYDDGVVPWGDELPRQESGSR